MNTSNPDFDTYWDEKDIFYEEEYYRFEDDFADLKEMFESANGVLYSATRRKDDSEVILKKIAKDRIAEIHDYDGRECPNEIYFHLKALEASPDLIVPLIDWYEFEDFYLIAMAKIADSIDLFQYIQKHGPLPEKRAKKIFKQIVKVAYDLQKAGICHRDLKDENVLLGPGDRVYLIDFGTTMETDSSYSDMVGTPCFFAPEFYDRGYFRPEQLTVWSLGAILYIMLAQSWHWLSDEWVRDHRDERHISSSSVKFIDQILNPNPDERLKLIEIINSDWSK